MEFDIHGKPIKRKFHVSGNTYKVQYDDESWGFTHLGDAKSTGYSAVKHSQGQPTKAVEVNESSFEQIPAGQSSEPMSDSEVMRGKYLNHPEVVQEHDTEDFNQEEQDRAIEQWAEMLKRKK